MTFEMWSIFHIIFMISPFVLAILLYVFTKNKSFEKNRKIGIILSIICIVILVLRNLEILMRDKQINPEIIPLQICHFANFVLLFAFLKNSKPLFLIAFAFNLPAAIMSIVFANSLENYATIINFRGAAYIFGHMLIVGITIWSLMLGFVKVGKKEILYSSIFIIALFLLSIPINNLFNYLMPTFSSNYFYTLVPEGGTPLEMFYKLGSEIKVLGISFNPIYIVLTMAIGFVVYFLMVLLGSTLNKKVIRKQV